MNPERLKRFARLSIFSVVITVFLLGGCGTVGFSYIFIDRHINVGCNPGGKLPEILNHIEGFEAFTIAMEDKENKFDLEGWFLPGTNGAGIIVLGGSWSDSAAMPLEVEFLHNAGYNVMTIETRSCADPPQITSLGYSEKADLKAALDVMSERPEVDPDRIGVFAHSMGGAMAIMTAAEDERIKALVATGNYGDLALQIRGSVDSERGLIERWTRGWMVRFYESRTGVELDNVRPLAVIGQISPRAVFLIHGSNEVGNTLGMQQFEAAGEPKEFWLVEGAGHGQYPKVAPEEYESRTLAFFEVYLGDD